MDFLEESYKRHGSSHSSSAQLESELNRYLNWFDSGTTDVWRHLDMLSVLDPFLENYPGAKWLTVGDGRFGTSATYIEKKGGLALATDIDDSLLKIACSHGLISSFKKCNAERLDLDDDSFDFSYCKQSYHHFPRPAVSVYEMLRVTKNAIMFTEPADWIPLAFPRKMLQKTKHFLKTIAGKNVLHHDMGNYEPDGNYVFTISEREFEKIALGLNLPAVAFKRFSDIYYPGVEDEKWSDDAKLFQRIKEERKKRKLMQRLGLSNLNNIQAIVFKRAPDKNVVERLMKNGYRFIELPRNPYVS